jgi:glycosyltransferase involved in cell wall biosynthesis
MPRALMALQFFPRGGSAHVAQNLARALPRHGWDVRLVSGSVAIAGRPGDARAFYRGLDVHAVDMTAALAAADPMLADPPLHPSYEDRPGAPDRVFHALDDATYEHHVRAWERELEAAGAGDADVLHLHHLTPLNEAAARVAPEVPAVGHLHGTELLMLEAIDAGHPWAVRMRGWAQRCERLLVLSGTQVARAERLLEIDPARCVQVPNGFDPELFEPRAVDRRAFWAGHDLPVDAERPVLLYVGRFTAVKRVPLLIEAFAAARPDASLVVVGGFPDEWEGEHPEATIRRTGAERVHLAGWHGHEALPGFFAASDAVVLPSVREQFGQVLVEGMACGLPAVAVDAHGPAEIVTAGETGWLVEPDDRDGLARALVEVVADPDERRRRGRAAREDVRARYAWPALAGQVAALYAEVASLARSR